MFDGSQDIYNQSLDRFYRGARNAVVSDDGDVIARVAANWHASLPTMPEGFPANPKLALKRDEADYLRERVGHRAPGTLFEYLVTRTTANDGDGVEFPWLHRRYRDLSCSLL